MGVRVEGRGIETPSFIGYIEEIFISRAASLRVSWLRLGVATNGEEGG